MAWAWARLEEELRELGENLERAEPVVRKIGTWYIGKVVYKGREFDAAALRPQGVTVEEFLDACVQLYAMWDGAYGLAMASLFKPPKEDWSRLVEAVEKWSLRAALATKKGMWMAFINDDEMFLLYNFGWIVTGIIKGVGGAYVEVPREVAASALWRLKHEWSLVKRRVRAIIDLDEGVIITDEDGGD